MDHAADYARLGAWLARQPAPEGGPHWEKEEEADDDPRGAILTAIEVGEFFDADGIVEGTELLIEGLSELHVALGGSGLKLRKQRTRYGFPVKMRVS